VAEMIQALLANDLFASYYFSIILHQAKYWDIYGRGTTRCSYLGLNIQPIW